MSSGRRFVAIVLLLLIGFGMVALADAVSASWPLFLTPIPYATIAWMVVREADEEGEATDVR